MDRTVAAIEETSGGAQPSALGSGGWRRARSAAWWTVRSGLVGPAARAVSHAIAAAPRWSPLRALAPLRSRLKGEMTAARLIEILDALDRCGVSCILAGGWGVDALAGRQSRRHDDADIVVHHFEHDSHRACAALAELGFRFVERHDRPAVLIGDQWTLEDGARCRIDLLRLEDSLVQQALGGDEQGDAPATALVTVGRVGARQVRCLAAAAQRILHSGFAARTVDRHDLKLLS